MADEIIEGEEEKPGVVSKIKKWVVAAATATLLAVTGYQVGDWSDTKGYPIISQETGDTLRWVGDSLEFVRITDSLRSAWVSDSAESARIADSLSSVSCSTSYMLLINAVSKREGNNLGDIVGVFDCNHGFSKAEQDGFDIVSVPIKKEVIDAEIIKQVEASKIDAEDSGDKPKYQFRVLDDKAVVAEEIISKNTLIAVEVSHE